MSTVATPKLQSLLGKRIAGPWRFAWVGLKGDNEFLVEVTMPNRWYACNYVCMRCLASKKTPRLLYTDFSTHAPWTHTMTKLEHYLRNTRQADRHALLEFGFKQNASIPGVGLMGPICCLLE